MLITGCGYTIPEQYSYRYTQASYTNPVKAGEVQKALDLDKSAEERILALDPENISEEQVRDVLSLAPAPRIVNFHGGTSSAYKVMESLSRFFVSMGYPENRVRNPVDGTFSYSCLRGVDEMIGTIAWYYEREGMRPMLIGHSQGGMLVVKILHYLADSDKDELAVWNPLTREPEDRHMIINPVENRERPVAGLRLGFAAAIAAGGHTRLLVNQWDVVFRLRTIPDTVEEFSGFYLKWDSAGADFFGLVDAPNRYEPAGSARVRTMELSGGNHYSVLDIKHLADRPETRPWVSNYRPDKGEAANDEIIKREFNISLAGDLWYHVKKYWVIELQKLIRAKRGH